MSYCELVKVGRYRKKPIEIEAVRFEDGSMTERRKLAAWCGGDSGQDPRPYIDIETLEGTMRATLGDWIIRGVEGEFYPCKDSVFQQTYEEAEV